MIITPLKKPQAQQTCLFFGADLKKNYVSKDSHYFLLFVSEVKMQMANLLMLKIIGLSHTPYLFVIAIFNFFEWSILAITIWDVIYT